MKCLRGAYIHVFIIRRVFGWPLCATHCIRQTHNTALPSSVPFVSGKMDRFMLGLRDKMSLINYTRGALCACDIDVVPSPRRKWDRFVSTVERLKECCLTLTTA